MSTTPRRGFTLLELTIVLAVLALVASLALPSFAGVSSRTRLKAVAETLATDLAEARFEAARRGQPLHVETAGSGTDWCWSVATSPGCPCGSSSCQLKTVRSQDHAGVELLQSAPMRLDASGQAVAASALFQSSRGEQLRVDVSALGRAGICAPAAKLPGYPAC
ncbi:MAG: GspH/FimT family pseudopilin [Rubrivivax sp.]